MFLAGMATADFSESLMVVALGRMPDQGVALVAASRIKLASIKGGQLRSRLRGLRALSPYLRLLLYSTKL